MPRPKRARTKNEPKYPFSIEIETGYMYVSSVTQTTNK